MEWRLANDDQDGVGTLFLWGEIEEWIVLIAMSIPPVWPLFRPYFQRFLRTTTSQSRSRRYKQEYQYGSEAAGHSGIPPPQVTTTVSISSDKATLASPGTRVKMTKYGEILEEPVDSFQFDGSRTAVSHDDEEPGEPKRKSLQVVDNIRNSKKLQEGWMELNDFKEHEQR